MELSKDVIESNTNHKSEDCIIYNTRTGRVEVDGGFFWSFKGLLLVFSGH